MTFEANLGAVASRMTDDVEQRLLHDEKQVSFQHRRQALHGGRRFHHDLKAAARFESADEPAHGRLEANLVEHRRVEQIRQVQNLPEARTAQRLAVCKNPNGHRRQVASCSSRPRFMLIALMFCAVVS